MNRPTHPGRPKTIDKLNLGAAFCDRLVVVAEGKVVADGPPAEIMNAEVIARYFHVKVEAGTRASSGAPFILPVSPMVTGK